MRLHECVLAGLMLLAAGTLLTLSSGCKRSDDAAGRSRAAPAAPPGPVPQVVQLGARVMEQGRVVAFREGVVPLPEDVRDASTDQKAYVRKDANGGVWVLLPSEVGPTSFKAWVHAT